MACILSWWFLNVDKAVVIRMMRSLWQWVFMGWCAGVVLMGTGCANVVLTPTTTTPSSPSGPPPAPTQNGTVTLSPKVVALAPGQSFQFTATASNGGALTWKATDASGSGGSAGSIDSAGKYTAPATVSQGENLLVTAALADSPEQDNATAVVTVIQPGQFKCPEATGNPQVAQYGVYLPSPGKASVEFGPTTDYGLHTWQVGSPANGGQVQLWVAGMRGQTQYHMRGEVQLANGATFTDADQTCTTGKPPVSSPVTVAAAGTPQPGIEFWNTLFPAGDTQAVATDLEGNVIWTYSYKHNDQDTIQGFQLLPNGDVLMLITYLSSMNPASESGVIDEVREVDLAGNTVRSLTMKALNEKMAASNLRDAQGNAYAFKSLHHDVLVLPNGHWVLLACYNKAYPNLAGTAKGMVLGDALVDVDAQGNPDWAWNTFDHLDVNRQPMNFPDWTHANGMLYSSDDHNLLLSIRHQNWVVKIEYLDGAGSGKVLWRLGEGGDFKLVNGTDPADWFYAQHGMNYFTASTTGVFRLGLLDNGNDRLLASGQAHCGTGSTEANCYSTVPVLEINEGDMTATLVGHYVPPQSLFSYFGGNAELLANGDVEADFASNRTGAVVQELDPSLQRVVWQATTEKAFQYHAMRMPSLYPGVQW